VKKREQELCKFRQRQQSGPGFQTMAVKHAEGDPSTHAHPWEKEIEEDRMERG